MEICVKMDTSQYYSGINSSTNENDLADFYCQQENQQQQQVNINEQGNLSTQNSEYQNLNSQWDQTIECKQEIDTFANYSDDTKNDNSNNINTNCYRGDNSNEIEDFKQPFQYNFGTSSQVYPNYNNTRPYQITSTGAPLPTWYHPPNFTSTAQPQITPNPQYQQLGLYSNLQNPNTPFPQYQQQYQNTPYMPSSTTTSPSTAVPSIPPEHMMNMIHLTNRYDYDNAKAVNKILNGREARNRAEKNRRDKLNGSIQELSSMVPHVAESPRRVDKTAVLRFSAHGLRIDYVFGKTNSNRFLVKPSQTEGLMRLLDTFLLSLTCRGQIVLVSPAVEQYLGHCQTDLFGQSILNITHPDDHAFLKQQLIPTDLHNLFLHKTDENGEPRPRTPEEEAEIDRKLREDRRDFTVRLARAGPRSEPTTYELVRIDGCFRRADQAPRGKPNTGPTGLQLIRRARGRDDNIPLHSISGNDIILIAMARVMKPPNICDRLIEACKYEYKTRHLIDGRIVQCDQRISIVAGYLTEEVSGLSPFTFMHKDDVRWVMVALRQMYDLNRPYGESCYRLISRTGQFIYLKTRGYLEVDEGKHQVHSFVCINTLVPEDEGRRLVKEMKKKFSVIVSQQELDAMESDIPAVENPQQLEKAILNLITNLDNARDDDNMSVISNSTNDNEDSRSTKSPPLSIIPPKPSTIKLSIDKSMNVIVSTIRKDIIKKEPQSPTSMNNSRPSVLQKNYSSVPNREKTALLSPSNEALKQRSNSESSYKNYSSPSCNDQVNIKVEPNIMSPTSSLSSVDSEYMAVNQNATTTLSTSETDDFSTPFDNIPIYDPQYIDTNVMATPAKQPRTEYTSESISSYSKTDSIIKTTNKTVLNKNNNTSNINRNTVLKRAHSEDTNSNEGFKKRSLVENNNDSCSSLLNAVECGTGLDISPSAFEAIDRSLSELEGGSQYNQYGMSPNNLDSLEDDIMSDQPESAEDVLQTLQEDYNGDVDYNEGNNNKKYNNGRS